MQHICRVIKLFEFYLRREKKITIQSQNIPFACKTTSSFRCARFILKSVYFSIVCYVWYVSNGSRQPGGWKYIKKACSFQNNFFLPCDEMMQYWIYTNHNCMQSTSFFSSTRKRNERWRWKRCRWWWTWVLK